MWATVRRARQATCRRRKSFRRAPACCFERYCCDGNSGAEGRFTPHRDGRTLSSGGAGGGPVAGRLLRQCHLAPRNGQRWNIGRRRDGRAGDRRSGRRGRGRGLGAGGSPTGGVGGSPTGGAGGRATGGAGGAATGGAGGAATGGAGGSATGGAGGSATGGAGGAACIDASSCPSPTTLCQRAVCTAGQCGFSSEPAGT